MVTLMVNNFTFSKFETLKVVFSLGSWKLDQHSHSSTVQTTIPTIQEPHEEMWKFWGHFSFVPTPIACLCTHWSHDPYVLVCELSRLCWIPKPVLLLWWNLPWFTFDLHNHLNSLSMGKIQFFSENFFYAQIFIPDLSWNQTKDQKFSN